LSKADPINNYQNAVTMNFRVDDLQAYYKKHVRRPVNIQTIAPEN